MAYGRVVWLLSALQVQGRRYGEQRELRDGEPSYLRLRIWSFCRDVHIEK